MKSEVDIREFLSFLGSEKGLSPNTLAAYEQDLQQFLVFCQVKKYDPHAITLKQLRDYLAHLKKIGLASRSSARKISSLRQYYRFLMREGRLDADPSELLSVQIKETKLPEHLSIEEIVALVESAEGITDLEIRDRALLELWYATGVRVSEIANLRLDGIDFKDGVIRVMGKGNRERLVPVGEDAIKWCLKYKDIRHAWVREQGLKEMDLFFLTARGKGFTRQGIWKLVKRYALKAGIARKVWPHLIRHSFATHVLLGGADLRAVQELMGHRSIATTEIYTHLDIENLKVMQLKYHPRS